MLEESGTWVARLVVRRWKDQGVVSACFRRTMAELYALPSRLGAAANDDGKAREAGIVKGSASGESHQGALRRSEVDGFAIGALGGDSGEPGAGQTHGVLHYRGSVDLLVSEEEAWSRSVDSRK